jgi:hypothetical protein
MAKRTPTPEEKIAQQIYDLYKPKTVEEMQMALKKVFAPIFETALKGEMENHLGYPKNGNIPNGSNNARNGYSQKTDLTVFLGKIVSLNKEIRHTPHIGTYAPISRLFLFCFCWTLLQDSLRYAKGGRGAQKMYTNSTSMGHAPA